MDPLLVSVVVKTAVVPAGVTAVVLFGLARGWRSGPVPAFVPAAALGAGFTAAEWSIRGLDGWRSPDITRWVPYAALLGLIPTGLLSAARPERWARVLAGFLRLGLSCVLVWAVTGPLRRTNSDQLALIVGSWFLVFGSLELLRLSAASGAIRLAPVALALTTVLGSGVIALGGSASLAQVSAGLAVALAVAAACPSAADSTGSVFCGGIAWAGLVASACFLGSLPAASAVLLLIAPTAVWVGRVPWLRGKTYSRVAVQLGGVAVTVGLAAIPVVRNDPGAPAPHDASPPDDVRYEKYYGS